MTELAVQSHFHAATSDFDYSGPSSDNLEAVRRAEVTIRQHARNQIIDGMAIGRELIRVKGILGHGQFGIWIAASLKYSHRTVTRYMRLAEVYGGELDMMANLHLPQAIVCRVAESRISDADKSRVLAPADDGSKPTEALVLDRLRDTRWEVAERKRQEKEPAKKTPARQARERRARERRRLEREQVHRQMEENARHKAEATRGLAKLLVQKLSTNDLNEFLRLWGHADVFALSNLIEEARR